MNINADSGLCKNEKEMLPPEINIAIVGGDVRQSAVAGRLHEAEINVFAYGIGKGKSDYDCFSTCEDYKNAVNRLNEELNNYKTETNANITENENNNKSCRKQ